MKLELKTENENYSKSISYILGTVSLVVLLIVFCDIALKLATITRHFQINHNCRLLYIEKSQTNFRKLSSLSNLKSKQKIFDFCKAIVK